MTKKSTWYDPGPISIFPLVLLAVILTMWLVTGYWTGFVIIVPVIIVCYLLAIWLKRL